MKVTQINRIQQMPAEIDFYFDFSSSYSYIALPGVDQLAARDDVEIHWKPIVLGAIFKAHHHAPPDATSGKMQYLLQDLKRRAPRVGLPPFRMPAQFPFNGMTAMRVFWHLHGIDRGQARRWARAVFHASFANGKDCADADVLADVASGLGHDPTSLLEASTNDNVKAALKAATAEAMERGVFGTPTFLLGQEMFWGGDRLPDLEHYITTVQQQR